MCSGHWGADRRFINILPIYVKILAMTRLVCKGGQMVDRSEISMMTLSRTQGSGQERVATVSAESKVGLVV